MKKTMTSNRMAFTGLFSAFVASLCCITPVLALLSGTTGIASTFSWIEPYRPILMGVTVLILGFAWYQKLKPRPQDIDCACEDDRPKFIQSKTFLFLITIFAGTMLAFPYYSKIFYPNSNAERQIVYVSESNVSELTYSIEGMTCAGCEAHIENEVNKLEGILEVDANYGTSLTVVKFDNSKVSANDIASAIKKTGYKIIE
ncbi:mercuric transport protein MerTP [Flagellimonas marinaquae]|jgi:copper chaperone CopZ|uniref:mercuric transport protein MerTP n=1 Tax=Flagellimonas marinaquae TaxID=254955 RepID=UPI0020762E8C|nr:mercuric transport protein MerTP [Allomuricauda aquimarina]USD24626.1 mercuric transport protein MerTP [Allomuricauda aquimarina]